MKESVKGKINLIGKIGKIISIVLIVLMFIAASFTALSGALAASVPKNAYSFDISTEVSWNYDKSLMGGAADSLVESVNTTHYHGFKELLAKQTDDTVSLIVRPMTLSLTSDGLVKMILLALLDLAGIIVCLFFFKAMMKALSVCDSPFSENVVKTMRNFAVSLLAAALVTSAADSLIKYFFSIHHSFSLSLNLTPIIAAGIILLLVMIFKYGVALQKESDETL